MLHALISLFYFRNSIATSMKWILSSLSSKNHRAISILNTCAIKYTRAMSYFHDVFSGECRIASTYMNRDAHDKIEILRWTEFDKRIHHWNVFTCEGSACTAVRVASRRRFWNSISVPRETCIFGLLSFVPSRTLLSLDREAAMAALPFGT